MEVLTKKQAYMIDKATIEKGHLNQERLMDNAGKAIAQYICEKFDNIFNKRVMIVCGKGNNGGDGIITHYYLKRYNVSSFIVFVEKNAVNKKLLTNYKIEKEDYEIYEEELTFDKYSATYFKYKTGEDGIHKRLDEEVLSFDNSVQIIVDAVFGIGYDKHKDSQDSAYSNIIDEMNSYLVWHDSIIVSIDIPSGWMVDDGAIVERGMISPNYTLSLGSQKLCNYLYSSGHLETLDIGLIKFEDLDSGSIDNVFNLINEENIGTIIQPFIENQEINKYSAKCSILAGSNKYPGAGILSAKAAEKTGSSYVELYFEDSTSNDIIKNAKVSNPTIIFKDIKNAYKNDICLFGPGLTKNIEKSTMPDTANVNCEEYIKIFDAGAFSSYNDISDYPERCILAPHWGEACRIFNIIEHRPKLSSIQKIKDNIEDRTVILKLSNIFIINKNYVYIIDNGPSLLSTAGTGDVLSGIIASLMSQGYTPKNSCILGTYLHGESAKYYMNNISTSGMTASDLIECIPFAFNKLRKIKENVEDRWRWI